MTTERAMTLEQMRSHLLHRCEMLDDTDEVTFDRSELLIFVDAMEGYLSRPAEPVYQHRLRIGSPNRRWFDCSKEEYEAMGRNEHDCAFFDRRILYTHPPEPARDAKRWQTLLKMRKADLINVLKKCEPADRYKNASEVYTLQELVDAAMAREGECD